MRLAGLALVGCLVGCSKEPPSKQQPALNTLTPPAKVAQPDKEPPRPAQLTHVTIKALGMYCEESCPLAVRTALKDHNEIYEMGFDAANESIFISYDTTLGPAKQVTKPMIVAIREKAGFDPWLAKEEWPADAKVQVVLRPSKQTR